MFNVEYYVFDHLAAIFQDIEWKKWFVTLNYIFLGEKSGIYGLTGHRHRYFAVCGSKMLKYLIKNLSSNMTLLLKHCEEIWNDFSKEE